MGGVKVDVFWWFCLREEDSRLCFCFLALWKKRGGNVLGICHGRKRPNAIWLQTNKLHENQYKLWTTPVSFLNLGSQGGFTSWWSARLSSAAFETCYSINEGKMWVNRLKVLKEERDICSVLWANPLVCELANKFAIFLTCSQESLQFHKLTPICERGA